MTSSLIPDRDWISLHSRTPLAPEPAQQRLTETPRVAFAPHFPLFGVPSSSNIMLSMSISFLSHHRNQKKPEKGRRTKKCNSQFFGIDIVHN
jgi:hypothetical protein